MRVFDGFVTSAGTVIGLTGDDLITHWKKFGCAVGWIRTWWSALYRLTIASWWTPFRPSFVYQCDFRCFVLEITGSFGFYRSCFWSRATTADDWVITGFWSAHVPSRVDRLTTLSWILRFTHICWPFVFVDHSSSLYCSLAVSLIIGEVHNWAFWLKMEA